MWCRIFELLPAFEPAVFWGGFSTVAAAAAVRATGLIVRGGCIIHGICMDCRDDLGGKRIELEFGGISRYDCGFIHGVLLFGSVSNLRSYNKQNTFVVS